MNVPSVYSSVTFTLMGLGTEEYICVIFLGTEEFKNTEEYSLVSCSDTIIPQEIDPGDHLTRSTHHRCNPDPLHLLRIILM
jgi:hypothetical protein